jgi:hypothetical protein
MRGFDEAWSAVAKSEDWETVSPELRPLLQNVYLTVLSTPPDTISLKKSIEELLEFLAGPGRTNANCWAADMFFMMSEGWERDWTEQNLPEELHDVLSLMGDALHDTVQAPEVASNFGCLPEQLLDRVRNFRGGESR